MNILVVTEKYHVSTTQNDGGARVADMLSSIPSMNLKILDFSVNDDSNNGLSHVYPVDNNCRFERRLLNQDFISLKVKDEQKWSDVIIFVHCSMMFGTEKQDFPNTKLVLLPMFTSKSYIQSGESIPKSYIDEERRILNLADQIITPSNLEKILIMEEGVPEERIVVIARGVQSSLNHSIRKNKREEGLNCLCLGSIKPQKNPINTIRIFEKIAKEMPNSKLTFIGPIQCLDTYNLLINEIEKSLFSSSIFIEKPINPNDLNEKLKHYDVHISSSKCETFGRAIIETSVMGMPNIILRPFNAAAELLEHRIGAHVLEKVDDFDAGKWLNEFTLETRSLSLVGLKDIFSNEIESRRVISTLTDNFSTVIADFDGTIFHKESPELTNRWVEKISKFDCVILCSARDFHSLSSKSKDIGLRWDAAVSYSGALITTNKNHHNLISEMANLPKECQEIRFEQHLIQGKLDCRKENSSGNYRIESYSGESYYLPWRTTKLRGASIAISYFQKIGSVSAFGDGLHDLPLIRYFGGKIIDANGKEKYEGEIIYE